MCLALQKKTNYDKNRVPVLFKTGDYIMYRAYLISSAQNKSSAKLMFRWLGPYVIHSWLSPVNVALAEPDNRLPVRKAHLSQLKIWPRVYSSARWVDHVDFVWFVFVLIFYWCFSICVVIKLPVWISCVIYFIFFCKRCFLCSGCGMSVLKRMRHSFACFIGLTLLKWVVFP